MLTLRNDALVDNQVMRKDATSMGLVNNFGWRPPGDNFEKANTAAA